jgi:hypothetical protein
MGSSVEASGTVGGPLGGLSSCAGAGECVDRTAQGSASLIGPAVQRTSPGQGMLVGQRVDVVSTPAL